MKRLLLALALILFPSLGFGFEEEKIPECPPEYQYTTNYLYERSRKEGAPRRLKVYFVWSKFNKQSIRLKTLLENPDPTQLINKEILARNPKQVERNMARIKARWDYFHEHNDLVIVEGNDLDACTEHSVSLHLPEYPMVRWGRRGEWYKLPQECFYPEFFANFFEYQTWEWRKEYEMALYSSDIKFQNWETRWLWRQTWRAARFLESKKVDLFDSETLHKFCEYEAWEIEALSGEYGPDWCSCSVFANHIYSTTYNEDGEWVTPPKGAHPRMLDFDFEAIMKKYPEFKLEPKTGAPTSPERRRLYRASESR